MLCAGWHGYGVNVIGVVVIEDKEVFVARDRGAEKLACLICEDLACDGLDAREDVVCPFVVWLLADSGGAFGCWDGDGVIVWGGALRVG